MIHSAIFIACALFGLGALAFIVCRSIEWLGRKPISAPGIVDEFMQTVSLWGILWQALTSIPTYFKSAPKHERKWVLPIFLIVAIGGTVVLLLVSLVLLGWAFAQKAFRWTAWLCDAFIETFSDEYDRQPDEIWEPPQ